MIKVLLFAGLFFCQVAGFAQNQTPFIIEVASKKVPCSGHEGQNECFMIRQTVGEFELSYDYIEGFKYTEGFTYTLKVERIYTTNPTPDAPESFLRVLEVIQAVKPPQH